MVTEMCFDPSASEQHTKTSLEGSEGNWTVSGLWALVLTSDPGHWNLPSRIQSSGQGLGRPSRQQVLQSLGLLAWCDPESSHQ
jgi:hypothetical protein